MTRAIGLSVGLSVGLATIAVEAAPLDDALAAAEPCRGLPGLEVTDEVSVESAQASIQGDSVDLRVAGRLACRSRAGAFLAGDASARVEAQVRLALATCDVQAVSVALNDFGGSFGDLLEGLKDPLQTLLAEEGAAQARDACLDLIEN